MNKFKKYLLLSLAVSAAAAAVVGCGNSKQAAESTTEALVEPTVISDKDNNKLSESLQIFTNLYDILEEEKAEKEAEKAKEEAAETTTEAPEASTEAAEATTGAAEATTQAQEKTENSVLKEDEILTENFALGTVSEDYIYTNTFFNIEFKLDPSWTIDTRDQLLQSNQIDLDYEDEQDLAEKIQAEPEFRDLAVTINDGDSRIIISTMRLEYFKKKFQGHKSAKQYYYKKLYSYFEEQGYRDILVTKDTMEIDGEEFQVLDTQMKDGTTDYFVKVLFTKKAPFLDLIIVTSKGENINDVLIQSLSVIPETQEAAASEEGASEESTEEESASGEEGETTGEEETTEEVTEEQ